jgi:hypothetical protein
VTAFYYNEGDKMIVIFPLLVSKNVNTNLVQGVAVVLEQYIAAYALSDFVGKAKEFNKYYNYKMKGGKLYQESNDSVFTLDPLTRGILEQQYLLYENQDPFDTTQTTGKKTVRRIKDTPGKKSNKWTTGVKTAGEIKQNIDDYLKAARQNKDAEKGNQAMEKPEFKSASISTASLNLEPTWVNVTRKGGGEAKLGIKVVPMMVEGFNLKHTISLDMQKYFLQSFITGIGRKVMRIIYKLIDKWTMFGSRPRGDIRQDLFYARTGHDGQPFVLLDKNEDIPKFFFQQPQNLLKLWKLSWGNILIADDIQKIVMFCMKKYKGMCSNFSYSMVFAQSRDMARVFEDMEDARKATGALFKMNKKITSLGGK